MLQSFKFITNKELGVGRLGGSLPVIRGDAVIENGYQYFITIPYVEKQCISVFLKADFDLYWDGRNKIHRESNGMVKLSIHPYNGYLDCIDERSYSRNCYGIQVGKCDNNSIKRHMLGWMDAGKFESLRSISGAGKVKCWCRLAFPGDDDCDIDINWPFSDGEFYILYDGKYFSHYWT